MSLSIDQKKAVVDEVTQVFSVAQAAVLAAVSYSHLRAHESKAHLGWRPRR